MGQHYHFTVERLLNTDFKLPYFQRPLVWVVEQKIKFIESLLVGIDVGTYTLNESSSDDLNNLLIDGQQRINAVHCYVKNEFKAFNLLYSKLSDIDKAKRFMNAQFCCYVTQSDDIEYLKNYYNLMNFGGTAHKESERA